MGMAFPEVSKYNSESVVSKLLQPFAPEDRIFAFRLDNDNPELTVGRMDKSLYEGDITYTPVTDEVRVGLLHEPGHTLTHSLSRDSGKSA